MVVKDRLSLELPPSVCSQQDVKTLVLEVREYARWYSQASIKKRLKLKRTVPQPTLSPGATELIHDWSIKKPLSTQSLDELIGALEALAVNAPGLTIVLAAPATGNLKKTLVSWCRKNIAPDILVSFEFNSTLLGGLVVRYGSRIFDWSFRRQILENSSKFAEVLRHV